MAGPRKHRVAVEAILGVRRAARAIDDIVNLACAPLGLTGVQYNILRILARAPKEGYSRSQILSQLIEKHADVTRSIDGLVSAGYVVREHSAVDRRVVLHRITEQGYAALARLDPFLRDALEKLVGRFSIAELNLLTTLCTKLVNAADAALARPELSRRPPNTSQTLSA